MNPWHGEDGRLRAGWRFVLGGMVAFVANFIAIGIAESASHGRMRVLELVYRPTTCLLLLAGFLLLTTTVDQAHEAPWRAMGLGRFPGWLRQAGLGIAIGVGLIVLAVICIVIAGEVREVGFVLNRRTVVLAAVELFVLATAAMGEELVFRGYPFQRLLEGTRPVLAVAVMSALFAVAHGANPHASKLAMVNTFAIAVLLSVSYLRTRALWMPWGIHFAWNTALGLIFGLPVSGLKEFSVIIRTQARGPRWVTGGAYGIEGSVVGTIVILVGFIPVIAATRAARQPAQAVGNTIEECRLKIEE